MHELIFAILSYSALHFGALLYIRWTTRFARDRTFESWCAGRPLVAAIRLRPGADVGALRAVLRPLTIGRGVVNYAGAAPWPCYRVRYETGGVACCDENVIGLYVAEATLLTRPDSLAPKGVAGAPVPGPLDGLSARAASLEIDALWLAGPLHAHGVMGGVNRSQRPQIGWLWSNEHAETGFIEMVGRPTWLAALPAPPDLHGEPESVRQSA
jgi:hypothetical protein